jgi:hypothetical protein
MRKSIASIVLATIAILMVTASVAAADPFGWRHSAMAYGATTDRDGQNPCCSSDWTSTGWQNSASVSTVPAATAHPTATPVLAATPVRSQAHQTQTVRPTPHRTTTHHTSAQTNRHHADRCDDDARDHDMHR